MCIPVTVIQQRQLDPGSPSIHRQGVEASAFISPLDLVRLPTFLLPLAPIWPPLPPNQSFPCLKSILPMPNRRVIPLKLTQTPPIRPKISNPQTLEVIPKGTHAPLLSEVPSPATHLVMPPPQPHPATTVPFHVQTKHLVPPRNNAVHGSLLDPMVAPWCTTTIHGGLIPTRTLVATCEPRCICISYPNY
ncbi:hypothetical protein HU200_021726 [Digitaria exilis]|uniref:Uncharacterized protein n=1 Tax=Digitaria exilis TaxID=1010633 RepID=A0A835KB76_9POAL|nr:hypothetical protein HU200_021726 [Digitaria exilis]